jgi:enamine deaminase RidA (YjgF/YER057c/UK114 family)
MQRTTISTGTRWEPLVGYSRGIRVGPFVYISGTTATDAEGEIVGRDDIQAQTLQCLKNLQSALERLGAKLEHVVRTRMYVTDIVQWEDVGRAHGQFFGKICPATSMVEVSALVMPEIMVEIEADAIVPDVLEPVADHP